MENSPYRLNITFVVENRIQQQWLEIIEQRYIPFLNSKGYEKIAFSRVISLEASDHITYSLLIGFQHMGQYNELTNELWSEYLEICDPLFGTDVVWFTSLMKTL